MRDMVVISPKEAFGVRGGRRRRLVTVFVLIHPIACFLSHTLWSMHDESNKGYCCVCPMLLCWGRGGGKLSLV